MSCRPKKNKKTNSPTNKGKLSCLTTLHWNIRLFWLSDLNWSICSLVSELPGFQTRIYTIGFPDSQAFELGQEVYFDSFGSSTGPLKKSKSWDVSASTIIWDNNEYRLMEFKGITIYPQNCKPPVKNNIVAYWRLSYVSNWEREYLNIMVYQL